MKDLSIFIDESGDFGKYSQHSPFYIVSMVFHEQKDSITEQVNKLESELEMMGFKYHTIHTAPLIRRESVYKNLDISLRKRIFNKLFMFTKNVRIKCTTLVVDKMQHSKSHEIAQQLSRQLASFIKDNAEYFNSFDNIIVYYDNGQYQLSYILNVIFSTLLSQSFEFRPVMPNQYKLFQTADLICTFALTQNKILSGKELSNSERIFFGSKSKLKKTYLKYIDKIKMK